ncbi:hypothetical protein LINGRAHAP2_LOCUS7036 [Linum grandiflorum]
MIFFFINLPSSLILKIECSNFWLCLENQQLPGDKTAFGHED